MVGAERDAFAGPPAHTDHEQRRRESPAQPNRRAQDSLRSRSADGIRVTGILDSLVESAKLCRVDPAAYLRAALTAAVDGAPIPLPAELS